MKITKKMMIKFRAFSLLQGTLCVAMPAWQRCYAGVATLLRRHGNVVMPAWQCCYAGMATGEAACTHRFNPLRIGFLGDKNAFSERETSEIIPSMRGALVLSK